MADRLRSWSGRWRSSHVEAVTRCDILALWCTLQHLSDLSGGGDRDRHAVIELRVVPIHLSKSQHFLGDVPEWLTRSLAFEQQGARHVLARELQPPPSLRLPPLSSGGWRRGIFVSGERAFVFATSGSVPVTFIRLSRGGCDLATVGSVHPPARLGRAIAPAFGHARGPRLLPSRHRDRLPDGVFHAYDVIVCGRPMCGGADTAMLLARRGYRVLLLDADRLPSDMPMSTHLIWQSGAARLHRGLLDRVAETNCPPIRRCEVIWDL